MQDVVVDTNTVDLSKLDELVEVLKKTEEEKKELAKEADLLKEAELEEQKLLDEQLEQEKQLQKELEQENLENENIFKDDLLISLDKFSTETTTLNEVMLEVKELQEHQIAMDNEVYPALKQSSELQIIFLALIPVYLMVRWFDSAINSAFR